MCTVRRYKPEDRPALRNICIATANDEMKFRHDVLLTLYCDYYLDYEREHCFVLENDDGEIVGYVIASYDYDEYHHIFNKIFQPKLSILSELYAIQKKAEHILTRGLTRRYPAHFHIDILPQYRRKGYGTELLKALIRDLKENDVSGVMLLVLAYNEDARLFFRHCGFRRVKNIARAVAYVMRLNEPEDVKSANV